MATMKKERKHLELEVSDFGPIARAKIALRPLTVFVGPSNTGKSYLAILIYALHRFFRNFPSIPYTMLPERRRYVSWRTQEAFGSSAGIQQVLEWARAMLRDKAVLMDKLVPVPTKVASFVWQTVLNDKSMEWRDTVERVFGITPRDLTRYWTLQNTKLVVRSEVEVPTDQPVEYHFGISEGSEFSVQPIDYPLLLDGAELSANRSILIRFTDESPTDEMSGFWAREFISYIAGMTIAPLSSPLNARAYYLPADRTGIMHAHQVVVSSLIRSAARAGFRDEAPLGTLSGVLADFLEQLVELSDVRRGANSGAQVAEKIEQSMLVGKIHADESVVNYPFFSYQPSGWQRTLPLMNTSSMVSELAPVVLYLRHVVQPGNTLIIEEPEAHLHPAMQREFTRQIAAMIHAGIRVIITTHSEWVLEELANLVYLSSLSKEQAHGVDESAPALTTDQVGVWLFEQKKRPRGSVVREVPMDKETGSFDSGFAEVSRSLYNTWVDIVSRAQGDID